MHPEVEDEPSERAAGSYVAASVRTNPCVHSTAVATCTTRLAQNRARPHPSTTVYNKLPIAAIFDFLIFLASYTYVFASLTQQQPAVCVVDDHTY